EAVAVTRGTRFGPTCHPKCSPYRYFRLRRRPSGRTNHEHAELAPGSRPTTRSSTPVTSAAWSVHSRSIAAALGWACTPELAIAVRLSHLTVRSRTRTDEEGINST